MFNILFLFIKFDNGLLKDVQEKLAYNLNGEIPL